MVRVSWKRERKTSCKVEFQFSANDSFLAEINFFLWRAHFWHFLDVSVYVQRRIGTPVTRGPLESRVVETPDELDSIGELEADDVFGPVDTFHAEEEEEDAQR